METDMNSGNRSWRPIGLRKLMQVYRSMEVGISRWGIESLENSHYFVGLMKSPRKRTVNRKMVLVNLET